MLQTRFAFNSPVLLTEVQLGETRGHASSKSQKNTVKEGIPFVLGSSMGASCPLCCCGIPSKGDARGSTLRWVFTPLLLRAGLF